MVINSPKPTTFRERSYTVAKPTPKVIGINVSCTNRGTDCLYAIYCTSKVNGMQANLDSCKEEAKQESGIRETSQTIYSLLCYLVETN